MDTIIEVSGDTEVYKNCQLQYLASESGELYSTQSVDKNFETNIVLSTSMLPVDVNMVCNGKVVSSLKNVYQSPWPNPLILNGGSN
jgi:hypothetical protein